MLITLIPNDNHNQQDVIISKVIAKNRSVLALTKKGTQNVSYGFIGDTYPISTLVSNPMSAVPAAIFLYVTGHW